MRQKIQTVLSKMSQCELAAIMGCDQSNISKIASRKEPVWVCFDGNNLIQTIEYERKVILKRKGK